MLYRCVCLVAMCSYHMTTPVNFLCCGVDDGTDDSASGSKAATPDGPTPSSCHANDRLLLEDLQPTNMELKGKIADVYLRMKSRAFVAVLGLYWKVCHGAVEEC